MAHEKENKRKPQSRGRGEGTVCQRKDGRWCAAISQGGKGGTDYRNLSELLGHSKVSTTLEIYVHSSDQGKPTAVGSVRRLSSGK